VLPRKLDWESHGKQERQFRSTRSGRHGVRREPGHGGPMGEVAKLEGRKARSPTPTFASRRGLSASGCTRKAASITPCVPARARRGAARLYRRGRYRPEYRNGWLFRTSRGHDAATVLSEQPMDQSDAWRLIRPARRRRRHSRADRQSHIPRDRHHRLPCQWRRAGARSGNGGAPEPAHHQALPPNRRRDYP
jgi:hypothetical protein